MKYMCHHQLTANVVQNDIIEAHWYFVDIGRTDREQIRSRNVLQSLLLILLRICSRSVCPLYKILLTSVPCRAVEFGARISLKLKAGLLCHPLNPVHPYASGVLVGCAGGQSHQMPG